MIIQDCLLDLAASREREASMAAVEAQLRALMAAAEAALTACQLAGEGVAEICQDPATFAILVVLSCLSGGLGLARYVHLVRSNTVPSFPPDRCLLYLFLIPSLTHVPVQR